jgi:iron complex outermembrane receptor protein
MCSERDPAEGVVNEGVTRRMTQSFRLPIRALTALTFFPLLNFAAPVALAEANTGSSDANAERGTTGLEEITVTARRREENAQKVPIAITAVSPQAMQDNNIATVQDLQFLVPSLTATTGNVGQRDASNVAIRGQGYGSIAGQPAVAMYLNEVPIPTDYDGQIAGGPGLFFDLENAQVLKGPQGTLFGRNTMGGAVLLQTARPTNDFGGRLQVGLGNYNNREIDGAINLPIVEDKLLARVAFNEQIRDGFTHVVSMPGYPNGIDLDNRDAKSVRGTVTFRPIESVQNDTIATYQKYTSHGSADFLTAVDPAGPAAATYPTLLGLLAQQQALGARTHIPIDTNLNGTGGSLFALENITKVDINDQLSVRNIFGFDRARFNYLSNLFGTDLPIFNVTSDLYPVNQITDEMQLLGKSFGGRLDWVAGAFYSDQGPPDHSVFPSLVIQVLLPPGTPQDVANVNGQRRLLIRSKALFAQGTYDLSDYISGLKFTAGVRETWDYRLDSAEAAGVVTSLPSDSSAPTWTAALEYQAAPETAVYVTSRRGYRAGGATSASNGVIFPFSPEYVTDFEVGVKSDWKIADVAVRTNADVYYQDYSNIQVNQLIPYPGQAGGLNVTTNAAGARLWGAEFEARAILTKNFQVGANFAYLSFAYTKFGAGVDSAALLGGETANRIPREYGVNARYNLPVSEQLGDLSVRTNWHWQAQFGDFLGTGLIPAYGLLNLSANWDRIGGAPVDAQLFVTNALNKIYESGGIGFLGVTERTYGDPRLYGVRFTYRFGAAAK